MVGSPPDNRSKMPPIMGSAVVGIVVVLALRRTGETNAEAVDAKVNRCNNFIRLVVWRMISMLSYVLGTKVFYS